MYKVNSTFLSIQGEGMRIGQPSLFLRMAHCNLSCDFCDTEFADYLEFSLEEIIKILQAKSLKFQMPVVITGGEPLLQIDGDFVEELRKAGFEPHIETNGTVEYDACGHAMPFITMSPKVPCDQIKLKSCHTLKVLWPPISPEITPESFKDYPAVCRYLQPVSGDFAPALKKLYELDGLFGTDYWKLSPQLHKMNELKDLLK